MTRSHCSRSIAAFPAVARFGRWATFVALVAATLCGCDKTKSPLFKLNREGIDPKVFSREVEQSLVDTLDGFFGQPNKPYILPEAETGLDFEKVALASGPSLSNAVVVVQKYKADKDADEVVRVVAGPQVRDDATSVVVDDYDLGETSVAKSDVISQHRQAGLYRQHCAHCHGTTGGGDGPTASMLNPYPRDFRNGAFKFVSGKYGAQPTRADLHHTLDEGIIGTAMPSFRLLPQAEKDALVEYVMYLSMRGQNEAYFRDALVEDPKAFDPVEGEDRFAVLNDVILNPDEAIFDVSGWERAETNGPIEPVARPDVSLEESIAKGRALFFDKGLNCFNCHGRTGLGDGKVEPHYDEWNAKKPEHPDWYTLPIQALPPRNLRSGVYRGGRRPVDIYRRIFAGIKPSGMPEAGTAFKGREAEIWHLVDYIRHMPFETIDVAPPAAPAATSEATPESTGSAATSPAPAE